MYPLYLQNGCTLMRQSHQISRKAAYSILHAARTAEQYWNRPLNYMVTINFWQLGGDEETIFEEFKILREQWFARWSRYKLPNQEKRNGTPTYAYAHEATHGQPHTHWLVHLQDGQEADFHAKLERYLKKRFGLSSLPDGSLHIQAIYNAEGAKLYLLKGVDPYLAKRWGIEAEYTGAILNRKAGTSANLRPKFWEANRDRYRLKRAA